MNNAVRVLIWMSSMMAVFVDSGLWASGRLPLSIAVFFFLQFTLVGILTNQLYYNNKTISKVREIINKMPTIEEPKNAKEN